ncbi:unnamed protein product [Chironomus riparius]|uniref:Uncharacterized protein n=1 Tax=Chironomus riparius TaxID=315576 RepID=A0A9N9RPN7_9DIPT|nr:unnamed protein product [Chironomus riparius]
MYFSMNEIENRLLVISKCIECHGHDKYLAIRSLKYLTVIWMSSWNLSDHLSHTQSINHLKSQLCRIIQGRIPKFHIQ